MSTGAGGGDNDPTPEPADPGAAEARQGAVDQGVVSRWVGLAADVSAIVALFSATATTVTVVICGVGAVASLDAMFKRSRPQARNRRPNCRRSRRHDRTVRRACRNDCGYTRRKGHTYGSAACGVRPSSGGNDRRLRTLPRVRPGSLGPPWRNNQSRSANDGRTDWHRCRELHDVLRWICAQRGRLPTQHCTVEQRCLVPCRIGRMGLVQRRQSGADCARPHRTGGRRTAGANARLMLGHPAVSNTEADQSCQRKPVRPKCALDGLLMFIRAAHDHVGGIPTTSDRQVQLTSWSTPERQSTCTNAI